MQGFLTSVFAVGMILFWCWVILTWTERSPW
jgi:hypothetical protein